MSSKVKELLNSNAGFFNALFDFCQEYGQTVYAIGVKRVALSDTIFGPHTQPTRESKGKGAVLPTYTLQQAGDCWDIINAKGESWTLESWECFENPELPEGFDETLASEIKSVIETREKSRKAFLQTQVKVDVVKRPALTIFEEMLEEDWDDYGV